MKILITILATFILLAMYACCIAASEADDYSEGGGDNESEQDKDKR